MVRNLRPTVCPIVQLCYRIGPCWIVQSTYKFENGKSKTASKFLHVEMMAEFVWPTGGRWIPVHHILCLPFKIYESHNCGHIYGICCPFALPISWHRLLCTWIFQFNSISEFLSTQLFTLIFYNAFINLRFKMFILHVRIRIHISNIKW